MLVQFGIHYALYVGASLLSPASPVPPLPPPPVEWLVFEADVPTLVTDRTQQALAYANAFGFTAVCSSVTVSVNSAPDSEGPISWAWSAGPGEPCGINISPGEATDASWWGAYVVLHEIAHIMTTDEPAPHGPRFRLTEAALLTTAHIEVRYVTDSEYPDQYWVDGTCAYGCQ